MEEVRVAVLFIRIIAWITIPSSDEKERISYSDIMYNLEPSWCIDMFSININSMGE